MNALKRVRSSSDAEDSSKKDALISVGHGERHPSLWLEDGNIIISAKSTNTGKTLLYRVHKSLLSRHSDVFAGLFSLPDTPANYGWLEDVNDIPVVHLPDDAEGITDLLNVLYNPLEFKLFARKRHPDFPITALRLVKLTDKYNLDVLKSAIISRFSDDWPKSLEEWDATDVRYQMHPNEFADALISRSNWPEDLLPEPISAAMLASELKITEIMTAIYLDMYRVSRDVDWDKATSPDILIDKKGARWSLATTEQFRKLVLIQDIIERNLEDEIPPLFLDEDKEDKGSICRTSVQCKHLLSDERHRITLKLWETRDPLGVLDQMRQGIKESKLCETCREVVVDRATELRD